mgnify:CR=1 FL=1
MKELTRNKLLAALTLGAILELQPKQFANQNSKFTISFKHNPPINYRH